MKAIINMIMLGMVLISGAAQSTEVTTYLYTDPLGSPIAGADENGDILWRENFAPYGRRERNEADPAEFDVGYTGKQDDEPIGLQYFGARYYNPTIGRFYSVDPVQFSEENAQTFNRYAYANNNPYMYVDPDGRKVRFAPGVSADFKKQFADAITYLNKGKVSGVIAKLESRPEIVTVDEPPAASNKMYFDPTTNTIVWDQRSALDPTTGGTQTPALGLLHEAAHALGHLEKTAASTVPIPGDPYHTAEEKRVIQNIENPAANKLGEATRSDHGARRVRQVKCSTCTK